MVLQKRLDHGFNGFQVPVTPRATRSARRRPTSHRRMEDNQMCAFDLLATVAGNILQEASPTSSNSSSHKDQHVIGKEVYQNVDKPLAAELSDEGSCEKRCFSGLSSGAYDNTLKEFPFPENDGHSSIASIVTNSSSSERFVAETVEGNSHNKMEMFDKKVEFTSSGCAEVSGYKFDGNINKGKVELHKIGKLSIGTGTETCDFGDPLEEKPPALIISVGNTKLSGFDENIPCSPLSEDCTNVPVVCRDDDENFSGCTHPSTKTKSFRPITCIGDRRIRKILASRRCRVAPESMDDTLSNSDGNLKPIYHSRKNCYKHQLSQMNIPFKKRKLFERSSISDSNAFIRSGGSYYSRKKAMDRDASGPRVQEDPGMSSSEAHQHITLQPRDSHVKLRIKSFRVPELFIEIPETATIGSLKRTVMDAVTTVLGGGLRVGIILKGKKVRDDNKTLLQTGISHDNQLDALGFTLEPNSSENISPVCAAESPHVPCANTPQPLKRYPSSPVAAQQRIKGSSDMLPEHQVTSFSNLVESDHDSAPSPNNSSADKGTKDSKVLVTVPETDMEALAVVPVHQKSKRSEIVRRRIRRPFSVAEVEALVQAVEKLGTGRWRDVKLSAFDDAKHRTYVDLKDKWKTLVHTARISPQQRRGEPVPQELLDRVLSAHAYWSQQQTKQQLKHTSSLTPHGCFASSH